MVDDALQCGRLLIASAPSSLTLADSSGLNATQVSIEYLYLNQMLLMFL